MDARVKCERFRKASKLTKPAGPKILKALQRFENTTIPLRNRISHSWPMLRDGSVYFCTVGTGVFHPEDKGFPDENKISYNTLFLEGLWLNLFSSGLSGAYDQVIRGEALELAVEDRGQQSEDRPETPSLRPQPNPNTLLGSHLPKS
jgi:hypothetical protein